MSSVPIPRSHEVWRQTAKERPWRLVGSGGASGAIAENLAVAGPLAARPQPQRLLDRAVMAEGKGFELEVRLSAHWVLALG